MWYCCLPQSQYNDLKKNEFKLLSVITNTKRVDCEVTFAQEKKYLIVN